MNSKTLIIILTCLLLVLVVTIPMGRGLVLQATAPIRQSVTNAYGQVTNFFAWTGDVQKIIAEKAEVTKERNELLGRIAQLEAVERQNTDLRSQLSLNRDSQRQMILAESSGLVDRGSAKYLLINKGKQNGITPGQIVISNNVLVGVIDQVEDGVSFVAMPITASTVIPAVIRYEEGVARGVVRAGFNATAQLEQVLPTEKLDVGAIVTTSGEGGGYPANLVIGKVSQVISDQQDVFQSATIEIPWNAMEIETVFIIR